MLEQLIQLAQGKLDGITRNIPELNDLDSKQVSDVTSQTVVNTILQLAKKGNFHSLREMLSGLDTHQNSEAVQQLEMPVTNQLQNKLNISDQSAKQLALMALPIILNMMNKKVNKAQNSGFDVNNALNSLNANGGGGMLNAVLSLFGGSSGNTRAINNILKNLIK